MIALDLESHSAVADVHEVGFHVVDLRGDLAANRFAIPPTRRAARLPLSGFASVSSTSVSQLIGIDRLGDVVGAKLSGIRSQHGIRKSGHDNAGQSRRNAGHELKTVERAEAQVGDQKVGRFVGNGPPAFRQNFG